MSRNKSRAGPAMWKLNENLLQDPAVLEDVLREVTCFFSVLFNTPECAPGMIWEAHKAVIRGVLIKHDVRIKRERDANLTSLITDIYWLETLHKHAPTPDLDWDLLTSRRQVTGLLLYKAKRAIQIGCKHVYISGNKCNKNQFTKALWE